MKRLGVVVVALAAVLILLAASGCGASKSEAASSGPAAGKTLVVMTPTTVDAGRAASSTKVGGVTQNRNQIIKFTSDASDTRLEGSAEMTVNYDEKADLSTTGWGTLKVTNEGGTWEGSWESASGAKVNAPVYFSQKLTGSGDYEGLSAYLLCVQPASTVGMEADSVYTGWITSAK